MDQASFVDKAYVTNNNLFNYAYDTLNFIKHSLFVNFVCTSKCEANHHIGDYIVLLSLIFDVNLYP